MTRNAGKIRLDGRDVVCYLAAIIAWVGLSAVSALALQTLRAAIGPLVIAILYRQSYYQTRYFLLSDLASIADRIALVVGGLLWIIFVFLVEDYLRSSISAARTERGRAISGGAAMAPAAQVSFKARGLGALARRALIAAIFPAAVFLLYGLLQGVLRLLLGK